MFVSAEGIDESDVIAFGEKRAAPSSFKFSGIGKRFYSSDVDDDSNEFEKRARLSQQRMPLRRAMQFRYTGIGKREDDDVSSNEANRKRIANSFRYSGIGKRADDVAIGDVNRMLGEWQKRRASSAFRYSGIGK